jgi:hypothetical protein
MAGLFSINQCTVSQIVGESNRFLFHVLLVHITTCIVEGKKNFFGEELFRTLLITAVAIAMYHIFFRKIIEPKTEKMKLICYDGHERNMKKEDIDNNKLIVDGQKQPNIKENKKNKRKGKKSKTPKTSRANGDIPSGQ